MLAQPPFSDLKAGKYLKIPEVGKYLEQASSFDYKKVLADLKTSAEKPFFEVKEEIEGKFYLQPTKNLCE
ncbi:MAG: hypothetical protein LBU14_04075 [Candidatus Peribacteria bacterium]|nr:hypothetical protein [Candidatus Peribacteria bacterium]